MTAIQIDLPDQIAEQARKAGLLAPEKLEQMIREELRRQAGDRLLEMMDRLHAVPGEPMTEDELRVELEAARAELKQQR